MLSKYLQNSFMTISRLFSDFFAKIMKTEYLHILKYFSMLKKIAKCFEKTRETASLQTNLPATLPFGLIVLENFI